MKKDLNILNATDYMIETFQHYNIIGLGEGLHGLENSHRFFQMLFDNKKIQSLINFIIVEFANTDYQDIIDKFIFGENVEIQDIRKIWRESTQCIGSFGEAPVYLNLLKKIRNINLTLPNDKKIRVLGGDPSIDWNTIHNLDDYRKKIELRKIFPAHLAMKYGVLGNQKVLFIYSGLHLTKISDETSPETHWSITTHINKKYPGAMKVIEILNTKELHLQKETENWPLYSIIDVQENFSGELPAEKLFPEMYNDKGKVILYRGYKIKDLFDALLYVGPTKKWKISEIPNNIFSDEKFLIELNRRREILGLKPVKNIDPAN